MKTAYIYLIIFIIIVILIISNFWVHSYYKSSKYVVFLRLTQVLVSSLFSIAIIIQVINYSQEQKRELVLRYVEESKLFLDDTLEIFIAHPEMNYYYEELLGIKKIDANTKRNLTLEHEITMLIFAKLAKWAVYINESDKEESYKSKIWLDRIMDTYMKSNIFKNYWINEYKPKLAGPATLSYMSERYNL